MFAVGAGQELFGGVVAEQEPQPLQEPLLVSQVRVWVPLDVWPQAFAPEVQPWVEDPEQLITHAWVLQD